MNAPTLDQRRAQHAWGVVQAVGQRPEAERKEFGREAKKLPVRILNSGLGPALLFLEAKNGRAPALRAALRDWLHERIRPRSGPAQEVVARVRTGDARFLRLATAESLAYLQWLVRFAEAARLVPDATEEG
jgi:CRISPR-associated protein Cmr5